MSDSPGVDRFGVTDGYHDVAGVWHATPDDTRRALHDAIGEPQPGPPMWFVRQGAGGSLWSPCRIRLEDGSELGPVESLPTDLPLGYHELLPVDGGPATMLVVSPGVCPAPPPGWGVAAQLYAMFSEQSQGIGDLADLAVLARWVHDHGGGSILLSPLHAPAPGPAQQDSPYYPASRRWRNPLHLRVPGVAPSRPAFIERNQVWADKRAALWARFLAGAATPDAPWREWAAGQGEPLLQWAAWCAAREGVDTPETRDFHAWLQWCIDRQLAAVRDAAPEVALIGDLAIGFDPTGADADAFAASLAPGCRIGAPPDAFNPAGQDWGLPPFAPWRLRAARYAPFIDTVRGALRGMQGLRIDHVMGMFRQYWIPPDTGPDGGAYVRFPADELLSIIALEATRAGAFVVGEDLGTVEPHVREALRDFGILGTTVMWFTDDRPEDYPEATLATVTTHDLPTIAGVKRLVDGEEILRERLGVLGGETDDVATVVVRTHQRLGAAPSRLKLATLDDLALAELRPNVPGTTSERPNWRIPLPVPLETLLASAVAAEVAAALAGPSHDSGDDPG